MADFSTVDNKLVKFTFPEPNSHFAGDLFYEKYKNAHFLNSVPDVRKILSWTDELRERYDSIEPGKTLVIEGMFLNMRDGVPLVLKKSHRVDESDVDPNDFTLRRLLGLVAAYVYNNRENNDFRCLYSVESESFGLMRPYTELNLRSKTTQSFHFREYLSAVSGAEYFAKYFGYYPFMFALRKFQLKKISEELLVDIAKMRFNVNLVPQATWCQRDFEKAEIKAATEFNFNLKDAIEAAPDSVKCYFVRQLNKVSKYSLKLRCGNM